MFWKALILWFLLFEIFGTEIHDLKKFPDSLEVPERCRKSKKKIQDDPKRKCGKAFLKAYDFDTFIRQRNQMNL
ncbi:unnamed protein product, partial [Mesorhabditis belari]|uniref:Uncharacterized protein n=1 Tax=Mesorhabditis belari TaxID=2138241 RepID=A0AAF3JBR4_9BILA